MTKLDELLKNEPVEWKTLGEVCDIGTGKSNRKDESLDGLYPFYVRSANILKSNIFQFDEVAIIIPGEGRVGDIFHFVEGKYALHQRAYRIHVFDEKLFPKYLYYYLHSNFKNYIVSKSVGTTATSIRKPMLENFLIPIPPLETQKKIAKTLDKFTNYVTELQSELQSELQNRHKQYAYYRDMLLSEEYLTKLSATIDVQENSCKRVQFFELNDIVKINRGKRLVRSQLDISGQYPVYQNSMVPLGYYNKYNVSADTTFIVAAGAAGEIGYSSVDFWAADDIFYFVPEKNILSRYIYYVLQYRQHTIKSKVRKASIPRLPKLSLEKLQIPLPHISVQTKIVEVLDKFQLYIADADGLLPEEIAQRQKQYEFYREKLLTFDSDMIGLTEPNIRTY